MKKIMVKYDTYTSATSSDSKDAISRELTEYINKITPDKYHLKQVVKCDINYTEPLGKNVWIVDIILIFEED